MDNSQDPHAFTECLVDDDMAHMLEASPTEIIASIESA